MKKDVSFLNIIFYGMMISFGILLPWLTVALVSRGITENLDSFQTTLAALSGLFAGIFLVLYSLAGLKKSLF